MVKQQNPKFCRLWLGPFLPAIVMYHPETIRLVLNSTAPKPRGFGRTYEFIADWADGLITLNGEKWARARKQLTPAFHLNNLKRYMEIYNMAADALLDKLDKLAESGESFDLCHLMDLCSLEVILKSALGYEEDVQHLRHCSYVEAMQQIFRSFGQRSRNPLTWPGIIFKYTANGRRYLSSCDVTHQVTDNIIEMRRKQTVNEYPVRKEKLDILGTLLTATDEYGQPLPKSEIRNHALMMVAAGHETTSTATSWLLYCLTQRQDYQSQVQDEIDSVLDGRESADILWDDLKNLDCLNLCMKESNRLYPSAPYIQRHLDQNIAVEGRTIPKGTLVIVDIANLHRHPDVWDRPDEFLPERFRPESMRDKDAFSYVPFSAGPRNCIGQSFAVNEQRVLAGRILQRYHITLAPDGPPVARHVTVVLGFKHGLWLRIKKR